MQDGSHSLGTAPLTQDKACVYDWEEISSNLDAFKDVLEKCKQDQDKLVWICSFC